VYSRKIPLLFRAHSQIEMPNGVNEEALAAFPHLACAQAFRVSLRFWEKKVSTPTPGICDFDWVLTRTH
jgi:hypothetical protein